MTEAERRRHPRLFPRGLKANIFLNPPFTPEFYEGEVVDLSHTGVRIMLKQDPSVEINCKIRIEFLLPESEIPFSMNAILKHHQLDPVQLGLHYVDSPVI
jgi:PilZ domain